MCSKHRHALVPVRTCARTLPAGFNVCIFAYGQTGSGKTHTMSGTDVTDYSGRGINYRALDDLFQLRDERAAEVGGCVRQVGGGCMLLGEGGCVLLRCPKGG